jgi:hypothetical protein
LTIRAAVGDRTVQRVVLTNAGEFATGPVVSELESAQGAFQLEHDTCLGSALASGASCSVDVAFLLTEVEQRTGALVFRASPGGLLRLSLTGDARTAATVSLVLEGDGSGWVDGAGTRCSSTCDLRLPEKVPAVLTALPSPGSEFVEWSGDCAGTDPRCELASPTGALRAVAHFGPGLNQLTFSVTGDAGYTLGFDPAGADCGPGCRQYPRSGPVTVSLKPASGFVVNQWTGCTPAAGPRCVVDLAGTASASAELVRANLAFITSATVVPSALGSVEGADRTCQALATDAGLPGTYVAWASSSASDAVDRVGSPGGWLRLDGRMLSVSTSALRSGRVLVPLTLDERGREVGAVMVATSTKSNGRFYSSPLSIAGCGDWKVAGGFLMMGGAAWTDGFWTEGENLLTLSLAMVCSTPSHLYCFGADGRGTLAPPEPPAGARHAFVTQGLFTGALGGVAAADALCASEAADAGLAGGFFAAIASAPSTLADRFAGLDGGWYRVDGVPVGDVATLATGRWQTALTLTARGDWLTGARAWSGAANWASNELDCDGWTNALADAGTTLAAGTSRPFLSTDDLNQVPPQPCNLTARLLCFER